MKKIKKIALALLYLVQVLVIFREAIVYLSRSAEEAGPKLNDFRQEAVDRNRHRFSWLAVIRGDPRELLATAPAVAGTLATIAPFDKHGHEHPPENRTRDGILRRETRRRLARELILINLAPLIQRAARPAAAIEAAGYRLTFARPRAILSPS